VRDVSPDYFTLEGLVGLAPDFLFAGRNYGLSVGTTPTPRNLSRHGIKTLALTESCAHVDTATESVSVNDTYQDLTNLGEIFGVESRAHRRPSPAPASRCRPPRSRRAAASTSSRA
jgi:iron complex transport system substrate-binding protein